MSGREALVFPGQGVDPVAAVGLLRAHAGHPIVEALEEVTGRSGWQAAELSDTTVAQPCIVAAGLLATADLDPSAFVAVAGHSLGEITALAFAGSLTPRAALELVAVRARLGAAVQATRPGAMVALMKVDADAVEWVRRAAIGRAGGVLELAVENGPRQIVLSGDEATVRVAIEVAEELGAVARVLGIGGAYHTPLLVGAVDELARAARERLTADPVVPVVSSTGGGVLTTAAAAPEVLGRALVRPVRWVQAMGALRDLGAERLVDAGPGRTLANLADKTPVLPARALADG